MYPDFSTIETPFYYYNLDLLHETLNAVKKEAGKYDINVHYALKANTNRKILQTISESGLGADCVSGNEIIAALEAGFPSESIVFAGVGKTDKEIHTALDNNIFCINCESIEELKVIQAIAKEKRHIANVALRINPDVHASSHKYITTGTHQNKFGIQLNEIPLIMNLIKESKNIHLSGLHFHIGSQITDMGVFRNLCLKVNSIKKVFSSKGIPSNHLNLGGGLGVNYKNPDKYSIPDFNRYFSTIHKTIERDNGQELHVELGRSIVAQCGSLITKVLYIKNTDQKNFIVADAGMTELIRPALYQSFHKIENLNAHQQQQKYDVVGPICETSDFLGQGVSLPTTKRGDLLAIKSCGAYGEVMASSYNLRERAKSYFSDELMATEAIL